MKVILSPQVLAEIRRHGEETYPHECCGFLMGRQEDGARTIIEIQRQSNEHEEGHETRFLITPEAFRAAERSARKAGRDMLGIYHSHPDHPARPSEYDRDHAWPWYCYLIITVGKGKAGDLNAWQLREDRSGFDPVALETKEI